MKSHLGLIHYLAGHEYETFVVVAGSTKLIWYNYRAKCHRKWRHPSNSVHVSTLSLKNPAEIYVAPFRYKSLMQLSVWLIRDCIHNWLNNTEAALSEDNYSLWKALCLMAKRRERVHPNPGVVDSRWIFTGSRSQNDPIPASAGALLSCWLHANMVIYLQASCLNKVTWRLRRVTSDFFFQLGPLWKQGLSWWQNRAEAPAHSQWSLIKAPTTKWGNR